MRCIAEKNMHETFRKKAGDVRMHHIEMRKTAQSITHINM